MKHCVIIFNFLFYIKYNFLGICEIQAWFDHVFFVVGTGTKIHIHQAILKAKIFHMIQMMIRMKIVPASIFWFLCMTKFVVNAILNYVFIQCGWHFSITRNQKQKVEIWIISMKNTKGPPLIWIHFTTNSHGSIPSACK